MTSPRTTTLIASVTLALAISAPLLAQSPTRASALQSLVAAERAFAKTSVERGIKAAFLASLADDAVIFRPGPVPGKKFFNENPPPAAYLSWEPRYADVATDGNLGFTTGPYELRPQGASDSTRRYGHFVTVWKRVAGGPWKAALDIGIQHAKADPRPLTFRQSETKSYADPGSRRAALLHADSALGSAKGDQYAVFAPRITADARLYRVGTLPVIGADSVRPALKADARAFHSTPADGKTATSGDFGYTYGEYKLTPIKPEQLEESGYYLRIWRRAPSGFWLVLLDLTNPVPKK
jgi:ketosteroid isomerase-like protein